MALQGFSLRRQPWSMRDFVLSAPEKWQESPSAPCVGSHDRLQKVGLRARGTSGPRRARADPRQAVLTTRCADRIRNPVLAGPGGRTRPVRHQPSPTAVGRGPVRCAAAMSATSRRWLLWSLNLPLRSAVLHHHQCLHLAALGLIANGLLSDRLLAAKWRQCGRTGKQATVISPWRAGASRPDSHLFRSPEDRPHRPAPAVRPSIAVTLISCSASRLRLSASAPGWSSP